MSTIDDFYRDNLYLTLATADANGEPWGTPLYYGYDEEGNLYIRSSRDNRHINNMRVRQQVFVTMFDSRQQFGDAIGLYMRCLAEELTGEDDIRHALQCMDERAGLPPVDPVQFVTNGPQRVFKLAPIQAWVNNAVKTEAGYIDGREMIEL